MKRHVSKDTFKSFIIEKNKEAASYPGLMRLKELDQHEARCTSGGFHINHDNSELLFGLSLGSFITCKLALFLFLGGALPRIGLKYYTRETSRLPVSSVSPNGPPGFGKAWWLRTLAYNLPPALILAPIGAKMLLQQAGSSSSNDNKRFSFDWHTAKVMAFLFGASVFMGIGSKVAYKWGRDVHRSIHNLPRVDSRGNPKSFELKPRLQALALITCAVTPFGLLGGINYNNPKNKKRAGLSYDLFPVCRSLTTSLLANLIPMVILAYFQHFGRIHTMRPNERVENFVKRPGIGTFYACLAVPLAGLNYQPPTLQLQAIQPKPTESS